MSISYTYAQIDESHGELSASSVQYERKYRVFADATVEEVDVIEYITGQLAAAGLKNIGIAYIDSIKAEAQEGSENKVWEITVQWKNNAQKKEDPDYPKQDLGLMDESFQTQDNRKKISYCHSETTYTRSGYTGTGYYNRIGMHGEGTEIGEAVYQFSLNRRFDYTEVNTTLKELWLNLYGCVNSAPFRGFGAGVVRFVGFSGRSVVEYDGSVTVIDGRIYLAAQAYYDVTFNFQAKSVQTNVDYGGIICASVPGWAHPWVDTIKVDDPNTGRTVDMPICVHIANVYPTADLNALLPNYTPPST